MTHSCGIDFGTSNSALAITDTSGGITLAQTEDDEVTLPSALFYPPSGAPRFGRAAMQAFTNGEDGRFMRSLKRILGTPLMQQGTQVNGKHKTFHTILKDFISHIKDRAESEYQTVLKNVVMGRPVHFVDSDSAANTRAQNELENIAKAVGFKNVAFQYEPIAAAFAHERKIESEKLALIADIGGGTSDFTVIRLSPANKDKIDRKNDILSNTGVRTGGNDLDKNLSLSAFMPILGYKTTYTANNQELPMPAGPFHDMSEWSKVNFLYTAKTRKTLHDIYRQCTDKRKLNRFIKVLHDETGHEMLSVVENTKINLTDNESARASLSFIEDSLAIDVTRTAFNGAIGDNIDTIFSAMDNCVQQAGIKNNAINLVVLTGGTTEVPLIKAAITKSFPHAALSDENRLSSVALGLGYNSQRLFQNGA